MTWSKLVERILILAGGVTVGYYLAALCEWLVTL